MANHRSNYIGICFLFLYKKMDNNFVLYRFGPNFKDDGGTRYSEYPWGGYDKGDRVFWPLEKHDEREKRLERERKERLEREREEMQRRLENIRALDRKQ